MSEFDVASKQETRLFFRTPITVSTATNTPSVDTKDYCAIYFNVGFAAYTDGSYSFNFQESHDNSNWTAVPAEKFIDGVSFSSINLVADTPQGTTLNQLGLFSTFRYVRVNIASSNILSGATLYFTLSGRLIHAVDQ